MSRCPSSRCEGLARVHSPAPAQQDTGRELGCSPARPRSPPTVSAPRRGSGNSGNLRRPRSSSDKLIGFPPPRILHSTNNLHPGERAQYRCHCTLINQNLRIGRPFDGFWGVERMWGSSRAKLPFAKPSVQNRSSDRCHSVCTLR